MKPAAFRYLRARSVDEAIEWLAAANGEGKIIAGGQSLVPMMNFRLVKPAVLIDINHIPGLDTIALEDGRVRLGALVRHRTTATDALIHDRVPIVHEAMRYVANVAVRNRGTFCGSVCHADPAAEMPLMTLLLNGKITAVSARGNRTIPAANFFVGTLVNSLEPDEFVTSISIETLPADTGWSFQEFARRQGDFALACVATTLQVRAGMATNVRFGMMGVAETPIRVTVIEQLITGKQISEELLDAVESRLTELLRPNSDHHASADYRLYLSCRLARRALSEAWQRASSDQGAPK